MISPRKILFWIHLIAGSAAGIVILIMSVTGVLLTYEKQVIAWADQREYRASPPPGTQRLPVGTLIERAREARGALPATVLLRSDPTAPMMLSFGRDANVFVNPYTGAVLGEGSPNTRRFFRVVTDWHRWLGAQEKSRPAGKAVTGACNLAFLVLVISGIYLWWPRKWAWQYVRQVTWFRSGLPGKARDFNWHNVIGSWCAVVLFFVVLGATVISYPWASNLVYRAVGEKPPSPQGKASAPAGDAPADLRGLEKLLIRAENHASRWRTISLRVPESSQAPVVFTIDGGAPGQPQYREILTLDQRTGAIVKREPYSSNSPGRRARTWLRFVHTGEYYGLVGQTLAGIAAAGAAVLVYTGLALAVRRFFAWRKRRKNAPAEARVEYSVR